jgi:hypothetical protein
MRPTALIVVLALAACASPAGPDDSTDSDDAPPSTTPGGEAPVLVIADSSAVDGPGITVAEALTHGPTDDMVLVNGSLFIDADGTVVLCEAIAESFPPQCGGERIEVSGLDPGSVADLQEADGVQWADSITLFGSVE